jgi:hypothetical protein
MAAYLGASATPSERREVLIMATKRTPPKSTKPAGKQVKAPVRPAVRRTTPEATLSVLDGSMKPLIRAAFSKRLRG